jgi:hypothetical protein
MSDELTRKEKIRLAGVKKFGTEAKWRAFLRESSAKSRRNHLGNGYFRTLKLQDPDKLKEISRTGGRNGKHIQ